MVLRFELRRSWRESRQPTLDNVKLYCTPIVNLFKHDAVPIRLDGKQDEYLLIPGEYSRENASVFSVDSVTGWQPGGLGYQAYVPFESFEHDGDGDLSASPPSYSIRQRPSAQHAGLDTWLGFGGGLESDQQTLSIELTCTNHNLPRQLQIGDINQACEQTPQGLSFRNICAPTASFSPPLDQDFLWRLISNLSLNYLSLSDINALKVILETYDLPRYHDRQAQKASERRLTRAIGARQPLCLEILEFGTQPGDVFLLCSDGLYQGLSHRDLGTAMSAGTPRRVVERLFSDVLRGAALDDLTAVVVQR